MEKNTPQQTAHRTLAEATQEVREWTEIMESRIANARKWGVSWTEIGALLGVSKQTAYARYGKPEKSKILDADVAGTSVTPSIFVDPIAPKTPKTPSKKIDRPAPAEFIDPRPEFVLRSAGMIDGVAQPGTGKGPHQCPRCGSNNHKSGNPDTIRAYVDCKPTKYDPQDITDHVNTTGLSK